MALLPTEIKCNFVMLVVHFLLDEMLFQTLYLDYGTIGRAGRKTYQIDGKEVVGLAYAVMSEYWNQGFAAEMAQASLDVGFGHLGFAEIGSWTLPVNRASQRVMEKLGFRYERDFGFAGLVHRFYRLAAGEWKGIMAEKPSNWRKAMNKCKCWAVVLVAVLLLPSGGKC